MEVGENEKWSRNTSRRRVFPQLFRVLPTFHECFYNSIETQSTCFLFLLENTAMRKRKTIVYFWLSKCKFSLLVPSLCQQRTLVLCLHRVKVAKYEIQKPSTWRATLFRWKFSSMFPVFHLALSTCRATKTFVVGWKKLLRKVERGSTLSNKFWLCCLFFIKHTTCRTTNLLVP